jgi:hypothetical protein
MNEITTSWHKKTESFNHEKGSISESMIEMSSSPPMGQFEGSPQIEFDKVELRQYRRLRLLRLWVSKAGLSISKGRKYQQTKGSAAGICEIDSYVNEIVAS